MTIRKDTIFEGSNLKCNQVLLLAYLWINDITSKAAARMSGVCNEAANRPFQSLESKLHYLLMKAIL